MRVCTRMHASNLRFNRIFRAKCQWEGEGREVRKFESSILEALIGSSPCPSRSFSRPPISPLPLPVLLNGPSTHVCMHAHKSFFSSTSDMRGDLMLTGFVQRDLEFVDSKKKKNDNKNAGSTQGIGLWRGLIVPMLICRVRRVV